MSMEDNRYGARKSPVNMPSAARITTDPCKSMHARSGCDQMLTDRLATTSPVQLEAFLLTTFSGSYMHAYDLRRILDQIAQTWKIIEHVNISDLNLASSQA